MKTTLDLAVNYVVTFKEIFMLRKTTRTWFDTILFKPKLRTCRKFKTIYDPDDYVMKYMSRRQRAVFAQFRAGILSLHIETGRWRGTPLDERLL